MTANVAVYFCGWWNEAEKLWFDERDEYVVLEWERSRTWGRSAGLNITAVQLGFRIRSACPGPADRTTALALA